MSAPSRNRKGLKLLAVDGRGPCGISTIIIMGELMRKVQRERGLSEPPRPGEVFDLMAGSGMGGLLVIMWGRMKMSVDDSKKYFKMIGDAAFSEKKWSVKSNTKFKSSKLDDAIWSMLVQCLQDPDARMNNSQAPDDKCKSFVCVTSTHTMRAGISVLFRSYPTTTGYGPDCSIFEAIRATCTPVGLFKPAEVTESGGITMSYFDGAMGNSNPTPRLLEEAGLVFPDREVACVISLGAGQGNVTSVPGSGLSQSSWTSRLNATLMDILTDAERAAEEIEKRFKDIPGVYFRLSVDQGLQNADLVDWDKNIDHHAWVYLGLCDNSSRLNRAGRALAIGEGIIAVKGIGGSIPASSATKQALPRCPPASRAFVGREDILEQMRKYFFTGRSTKQLVFVLHGLGGLGKSQIAYKFVENYKNQFDEIFCIDATTEETIDAHLKALAVVKDAGDTLDDALDWLAGQSQNWLIVFNNANCSSGDLERFLPCCSHGKIIVTTRNHGMVTLAYGAEADCRVSGLSCDDALKLLLEASQAKGEVEKAGLDLVKELGFFPLAIVQAAAYIRTNECTIQQFHDMYKSSRGNLLEVYPIHAPGTSHCERTARAIWRMCYEKLSPTASRLFTIFAFMHHSGISEDIFRSASKCFLFTLLDDEQKSRTTATSILSDFMKNNVWEKPLFLKCIKELRSYSLVDFDPHSQHYSIHPLVQYWTKQNVQNDEAIYGRCTAFLLMLSSWNDIADDTHADPAHSLAIASHVDTLPDTLKHDMAFCTSFARVYFRAGRYTVAETLQQINLERTKDRFGEQHIMTLHSERMLMAIYSAQHRWTEITRATPKLLDISRRVLGENDRHVTEVKQLLAIAFTQQERYSDAESVQKEALGWYTGCLGPSDPNTCAARAYLTFVYISLGKIKEAEELNRVVSKEEILGQNEYESLRLHNFPLIQIFSAKGQWHEAAELQQELVTLSSRLHGSKSPTALFARRSLAAILARIPTRFADSKVLAKQVVNEYIELDAKNPSLFADRWSPSTALLYSSATEAETMLREQLEVTEGARGPAHTLTLSIRLALGRNLMEQRRWHEAKTLLDLPEELQQALLDKQPSLRNTFLFAHRLACLGRTGQLVFKLALSPSFPMTTIGIFLIYNPVVHSTNFLSVAYVVVCHLVIMMFVYRNQN